MSILNPSTPLGFLKNNDDYFRELLTYSFNKELVLYSTFPFLESWFILLLLHNHRTSLWRVQQLLTWKSNIRKVCIFSCLLMWCSSWKQGGETVCGDLTALPTTTWDQNVGKPFHRLDYAHCAWHFNDPDTVALLLVVKSFISESFPWLYLTNVLMYRKSKFCEAFCLY